MRASIRQVAELAQVSPMTVSRVLRGRKSQVREVTYERVVAALHELNYVPVRSAMQNRHVETQAIGLVPYHVNVARNQIDSLTFAGLCDAAHRLGYDLLVMLRDEAEWMAHRSELRFLDRRSDGFIFISVGIGEWSCALETLAEHTIPTVVCYRRDVPAGVAWVDPDNEEIVRRAVGCLRGYGHTKIAYLSGPDLPPQDPEILAHLSGARNSYDDRARREAFEALMAKSGGCEFSMLPGAWPDWEIRPQVLEEIVRRGITGVVCVNDLMALQLWDLADAAGVSVPQQISIIGVDDTPQSEPRGLSTMAFGYDEVGRLAVSAWVEFNGGKSAQDCCKVVPVRLIERASVGAAPQTV